MPSFGEGRRLLHVQIEHKAFQSLALAGHFLAQSGQLFSRFFDLVFLIGQLFDVAIVQIRILLQLSKILADAGLLVVDGRDAGLNALGITRRGFQFFLQLYQRSHRLLHRRIEPPGAGRQCQNGVGAGANQLNLAWRLLLFFDD